ncbi:hypothetical protein PVAND_015557 [Polypedilum vanderplanki]|uniref:GYF domain-containing protein n=1 Tax=Polypedilum vanderplanki TaxID=319348 RepID=A0A9J6BCL4_POLVA|nr:hypothetical protein PVAND_015557 [Polypedilum vanderplanki]
MTESIKFGPEWLRNSVANVVAPSNNNQQQQQQPQSPSTDSIISRPVLSDHRYGREEMLSLCDKSARLPDALPRFRRLFVADWQTPLALQPLTDDEQIGGRGGLGTTGTPPWGTHIRPLMPAMSRGTGMIRGGAIERGRGRGRGLYHGTSYTRSTSLYDEDGRRWLDRNGTEGSTEWSAGSAISPRKEGFSRSALESWRKGTRDENEEGWRSNSNGTAVTGAGSGGGTSGGTPAREKWTRSTSWREGTDNSIITSDGDRSNGTSQLLNSSSPTSGVTSHSASNPSLRTPVGYKKSWDEDSNLPEWATESFDYGGTFDSSGAFHDSERTGGHEEDNRTVTERQQQQQQQQNHDDSVESEETNEEETQSQSQQQQVAPTKLMMDFLNEKSSPPPSQSQQQQQQTQQTQQTQQEQKLATVDLSNGPTTTTSPLQAQIQTPVVAPIAQMDKMVENFVAHLIMDDDSSLKQPPPPIIEWFYRDPQGDTQGPFSSSDMSEWYKAGYFQESLMVRRSIDSTFVPLGQLVKVFGALRPFIAASHDGQPLQTLQPEPIDQFRLQRMTQPQQQPQQSQPPPQPTPANDVNNWSMMTPEQRLFLMQLAHQRQPQPPVDPYAMKMAQQQSTPLDMRRMMSANDFFQTPTPNVVPQQPQQTNIEPDPLQQLIMQIQMQQKTGGGDTTTAQQPWIKPSQSNVMMQGNGPMDIMNNQRVDPSVVNAGGVVGNVPISGGNNSASVVNNHQNNNSSNWNTPSLPIWDTHVPTAAVNNNNTQNNSNNILKDQNQHQQIQQEMQQQHHQRPPSPDIIQNGIIESEQSQQHHHAQMQKVESKKKKKEAAAKEQQQQQVKEQQQQQIKKQQQQPKEEKKKPNNDKQKREERSTQPAAPAPWVGLQTNVTSASLTKIQKTEAQRRQIELAQAQKERTEVMAAKITEVRDVKWNLQMPATAHVKSLDEIQAEEQTAAEREAAIAKREKKETVTIVADIWSSGAHSMAWQQPKAWSGASGQSNSGFWEDPVKAPPPQVKQPQMLSKSQTMATITTAKKQQQQQQQQQMQQQLQQQQQKRIEKKPMVRNDKKKEEVNNEFTQWCTRTLSAMNGNVDVPTFVSFLQDIESPFEIKDYIKMYLGETKECTEFAKQFLERRSKQRNQQRLQNAHIDDMCSPAPAINPNNSSDFQEVKGKNKKVKSKKVMKAVDNRILGFTATSAPDRINVGDRDYGDA